MAERTTQTHIDHALRELTAALTDAVGEPVAVTLHRGNGSYRIHNVLIIGGFNVWAEGRAGTTAREAYNALRVMTAAIHVISDIRELVSRGE